MKTTSRAYVGNGPRSTAALRALVLGVLADDGVIKITETDQKIGRGHDRVVPLLKVT